MDLFLAPDIQKKINFIIKKLNFSHIDSKRVICFRSKKSKSRAYARIWAFPKIWQVALNLSPYYCIEVLSERFDKLRLDEQIKVLIHELLHIPKNFSGALLPHFQKSNFKISKTTVEKLYQKIKLERKK